MTEGLARRRRPLPEHLAPAARVLALASALPLPLAGLGRRWTPFRWGVGASRLAHPASLVHPRPPLLHRVPAPPVRRLRWRRSGLPQRAAAIRQVLVQIIWEALVPILVEMLSLAEVLAPVRVQMRAARAALVTPLGLDLQAKPQETVENNAARLIRWAEEKVMLLSEFTASALPVNLGAVSANSFEEALERHKLLESEAIAALADARTASPASPADAAQQIRLKAAQSALVRSRLTSRRWAAMAEQSTSRS
ncbi:unnamed protein product [Prorocentrum cordatum]|uniref:Uncharacterized protein n=1 Tax=Prorocentrum cordatum TaxID=2364126 RepID=A0ABN9Y8I1_9DINO|nr:unnamed protein product [Polarella glacialis]